MVNEIIFLVYYISAYKNDLFSLILRKLGVLLA